MMPDTQKIIDKFTVAYMKVYGSKPTIESKGGWHKINGEQSVRLAEIESMTRSLAHTKPIKQNTKPVKTSQNQSKRVKLRLRNQDQQQSTKKYFQKSKTEYIYSL